MAWDERAWMDKMRALLRRDEDPTPEEWKALVDEIPEDRLQEIKDTFELAPPWARP